MELQPEITSPAKVCSVLQCESCLQTKLLNLKVSTSSKGDPEKPQKLKLFLTASCSCKNSPSTLSLENFLKNKSSNINSNLQCKSENHLNTKILSIYHCKNCSKGLCIFCKKSHQINPSTSFHSIVEIYNKQSCKKHQFIPNNDLDFFDINENKFLCLNCVKETYGNEGNENENKSRLIQISDFITPNRYSNIKNKIKNNKSNTLNHMKKIKNNMISLLNKQIEQIESSYNHFAKTIQNEFDLINFLADCFMLNKYDINNLYNLFNFMNIKERKIKGYKENDTSIKNINKLINYFNNFNLFKTNSTVNSKQNEGLAQDQSKINNIQDIIYNYKPFKLECIINNINVINNVNSNSNNNNMNFVYNNILLQPFFQNMNPMFNNGQLGSVVPPNNLSRSCMAQIASIPNRVDNYDNSGLNCTYISHSYLKKFRLNDLINNKCYADIEIKNNGKFCWPYNSYISNETENSNVSIEKIVISTKTKIGETVNFNSLIKIKNTDIIMDKEIIKLEYSLKDFKGNKIGKETGEIKFQVLREKINNKFDVDTPGLNQINYANLNKNDLVNNQNEGSRKDLKENRNVNIFNYLENKMISNKELDTPNIETSIKINDSVKNNINKISLNIIDNNLKPDVKKEGCKNMNNDDFQIIPNENKDESPIDINKHLDIEYDDKQIGVCNDDKNLNNEFSLLETNKGNIRESNIKNENMGNVNKAESEENIIYTEEQIQSIRNQLEDKQNILKMVPENKIREVIIKGKCNLELVQKLILDGDF